MHRTLRTTLLVYAAAAGSGLAWLADAQEVADGGIAALYGTDDQGPWNERREEKSNFDTLLQSPNATGDFPVPGPSISSPATASNTSEGWSWSINVVADVPIPSQIRNGDEFYTGGKLVFSGPSSPENSSSDVNDDGWPICLYKWSLWGSAYPASLRVDDGTCSSVLSSECIAAMEQAAALKHTSRGCSCPIAKDIPECAALGNDSALWSSNCAAFRYNASTIRAWGADGHELVTFGDKHRHERGNITAYNYIGSLAWPVMASFENPRTGALATAKMSCPRAVTAAEGSVAPTGDGLDAGDGQDQDGDDGQSDQQDVGGRTNADWLVLGSVLIVAMVIV